MMMAMANATGRATDASYTGAQTAQSRTVTFRVVRAEELFREILLRQQSERAKFRKWRVSSFQLAAVAIVCSLARRWSGSDRS